MISTVALFSLLMSKPNFGEIFATFNICPAFQLLESVHVAFYVFRRIHNQFGVMAIRNRVEGPSHENKCIFS